MLDTTVIPQMPCQGRVLHEKYRSVNVVKGEWSVLKDTYKNRQLITYIGYILVFRFIKRNREV